MFNASSSLLALALGLPAGLTFRTAKARDWTQKKAFSGRCFLKRYLVAY